MNDDRTARLSFSSEIEATRWFGGEILDHQPSSVRMGFMGGGTAPLLLHHDQRQLVGVVSSAAVGSDRRGYATVRFGRGGLAERARQDVEDGILRNVSVGYRVHKMVLDREDEDREVYRVTDWEPLEASLVSIPVDSTVGVGRSEVLDTSPEINIPLVEERKMTTENTAAAAAPVVETTISLAGDSARAARDERSRIREIQSLAARHNIGSMGEEAVEKGVSIDAFRGVVLAELDKRGSAKPLNAVPGDLELTAKERKDYSLSRAILGMADGILNKGKFSGFEREASDEIARRTGVEPKGLFVPYDLVGRRAQDGAAPSLLTRTMTAGTTSAGGAVVQSTVLAGQYVPPNYNVPVVVKAGARVLSGLQGNILIPAITSGKSVTWASSENAAITAADPTFAQISLSPKDMGAVADISRRLLLQSNPAVDGLVRDDIAIAIANGLDAAALNGAGSSGVPQGLLQNSNIGIQAGGTNGAALSWANLTYLPQLIAAANRLVDGSPIAFVSSAAAFYHAARTVKVSGYPTFLAEYAENSNVRIGENAGSIMGYPVHLSQNVPSNITKGTGSNLSAIVMGNWSDLLIGEWGVLDMLVDPYTFSNTGAIRVRAFMTVDVNVRYAGAFATIKDIVTT